MKKNTFTLALVATLLAVAAWFGGQAMAASKASPTDTVPVEAPTEATTEDTSEADAKLPAWLPEPVKANGCGEQDCFDNNDCSSSCPSANSAICDSQGVCQFVFGNPGNSGGGSCPEADCWSDSDCQSECPGSSIAICTSESTCFYG